MQSHIDNNKNKLTIKTPGKLNLFLKINGIAKNDPKNRHLITTVFQAINIFDYITVEKSEKTSIEFLRNSYTEKIFDKLPKVEKNICYKAIENYNKKAKTSCNFKIVIDKHIPLSGGLAGGSSDCAATLFAINKLCNKKISHKELLKLSSQLGSDIAFLLEILESNFNNTTCFAENFGDIITPINLKKLDKHPCLITFNFGLSTKNSYKSFDDMKKINKPSKKIFFEMEGNLSNKKNVIEFFNSYSYKGHSFPLHNDLHGIALNNKEILQKIITWFDENKIPAQVTGSGPTIFAFLDSEDEISKIKKSLNNLGNQDINSIQNIEFI